MKFTVVIVTFNRLKLLKECLRSVLAQSAVVESVIIVENASPDKTAEWLKKQSDKKISVIYEKENIGGAGGFHDGLKAAADKEGDWILLIDDDAILEPDYLSEIAKRIKRDQRDGKTAPVYSGTVYENGRINPAHRKIAKRRFRYSPQPYVLKRYEEESFFYDFVSFCGMVMSRTCIETAGLPLKEYFIWCDDFEYSLRLRREGRFININQARLNHKVKPSGKNTKVSWKEYYGIRNRIHMVKKHYGMGNALLMAARSFAAMLVRIGRDKSSPRLLCGLYWEAVYDGFTGKLGKNEKYCL